MKKQNSQAEIAAAIDAAAHLDDVVDELCHLDDLAMTVYNGMGDVGLLNMRTEMKIAMYRAARSVADSYKRLSTSKEELCCDRLTECERASGCCGLCGEFDGIY